MKQGSGAKRKLKVVQSAKALSQQRHSVLLASLRILLLLPLILILSSCSSWLNVLREDANQETASNRYRGLASVRGEYFDQDEDRDLPSASEEASRNQEQERSAFSEQAMRGQREVRYRQDSRLLASLPNDRSFGQQGSSPGPRRVTREDFIDHSQEEGSLWASSGQTNYYFTKNKVRSPGDIITLTMEEALFKNIGNEIKLSLDSREQSVEVSLLQDKVKQKLTGKPDLRIDQMITSSSAPSRAAATPAQRAPAQVGTEAGGPSEVAPSGSPATPLMEEADAEKVVAKLSIADVDIYPSLEVKTGDQMMGEILERFPNGNYRIRASKRVNYVKGDPRLVTIIGVVKATDIHEETDMVESGKLYATEIQVAR